MLPHIQANSHMKVPVSSFIILLQGKKTYKYGFHIAIENVAYELFFHTIRPEMWKVNFQQLWLNLCIFRLCSLPKGL
jgi:hypothetical protein